MIRKALIALTGAVLIAVTLGAAPAGADLVVCNGYPYAPSKTGNYVTGRGSMQCSSYNELTGWRMQLVLQDTNGNNLPGTATGWIPTPARTYIGTTPTNSASLCLNSASKRYRTEIQISFTHVQTGYSGIHYAQSGFQTIACGIAGYS